MKRSNLPVEVVVAELGTGKWLWTSTTALVPAGIIVTHGDHMVIVSWADSPLASSGDFTVDSLNPLTVVEVITCPTCGERGRIAAGAWQLVTEGVGA